MEYSIHRLLDLQDHVEKIGAKEDDPGVITACSQVMTCFTWVPSRS